MVVPLRCPRDEVGVVRVSRGSQKVAAAVDKANGSVVRIRRWLSPRELALVVLNAPGLGHRGSGYQQDKPHVLRV
jgi:hypothetical protein